MLPTDAKGRKAIPVYSGFVAYFPRTMCAVAELSMLANEQHNPGQSLHWAKEKSTDEKDALMRHLIDPLTNGGDPYDSDRVLHATKKAWRACADLERLLETGIPTLRSVSPVWVNLVDRQPSICHDCGADLEEGVHAPTCLRLNRQHY